MIIIIRLLIGFITLGLAKAQDLNQHNTPTSSNFQPSLFVVIGVLSFMFALTLILLLYAKFFHSQPYAIHSISRNDNTQQQQQGMFGSNTRFSGIDKTVVNSLPFFRFSNLKGSKQGLQCAVCLSEFQDVEILRLLPKCKHGFHIECVDLWLENHSTCPLCRQKVSIEDLTNNSSRSMRFIINGCQGQKSDAFLAGEDAVVSSSSFELFLERETDDQRSSSRFSIGGSFSEKNEEKEEENNKGIISIRSVLHRLNHQIVVSDVVFKNRWSNVSSSDLMFLNTEMLGFMSSNRFSSSNLLSGGNDQNTIINLRDEMSRKLKFEHKFGQINSNNHRSKHDMMGFEVESNLISGDKRAMSEIIALSRFKDSMSMKNKLKCLANSEVNNCDNDDDFVRGDLINRRNKWFPIAKRTVQWFANREKYRFQLQQQTQDSSTSQTFDV